MFDAKKAKKECIEWIKNFFKENGPDCNAIVGISGGKDSTVVAKLCVEALGKERVVGVLMPNYEEIYDSQVQDEIQQMLSPSEYNYAFENSFPENIKNVDSFISTIKALSDGLKVCNELDIDHFVVNISGAVSSIETSLADHNPVSVQTKINLPARIRMSTLYAVAQSMNGRVANTSNASEILLGYGTRWGDTVGDFAPIAELTCSEVKKLGYELGLPKQMIERTPDDGLSGKSDEDNFGFTYSQLDDYIRSGKVDSKIGKLIDERVKKNEFKRKPIPKFPVGLCLFDEIENDKE